MTVQPHLLEPDLMDAVWWRFLDDLRKRTGVLSSSLEWTLSRRVSYAYTPRRDQIARHFENWLYDQGAVVRQIQGVRHLEFTDHASATMFVMRWLKT